MVPTQEQVLKRMFRKVNDKGEIIPLDPEQSQYLLLLYYCEDGEKTFEIITGRTNVIEYLVENIQDIDIKKSFLLTEDDTLSNNTPLRSFLNSITVNKLADDGDIATINAALAEISDEEN